MQVAQDYWNLCGKDLKWMTHPRTFRWKKIPKNYTMSDWLAKYPEEDWVWQMIFHGGRINKEANNYQILGVGDSRRTFDTSYLYLFMPIDWFDGHTDEDPLTLYLRWAEMLQAEHGSAGIGLIPAEDGIIGGATSRLAAEFSRVFPGAELCNPLSQSITVLEGLLSVNWLNLIDNNYMDKLGGIENICQKLESTNAKIHPYQGGVIISTGDYPELCEQGQLTVPPKSYQPVAQLLKPIRTKYKRGFWGCPSENIINWLARFDGE
jgi:Protein of unknown function (DUF3396).